MNGASELPAASTNRPIKSRITMIGVSHHFFS
jgi:hypothetical protein